MKHTLLIALIFLVFGCEYIKNKEIKNEVTDEVFEIIKLGDINKLKNCYLDPSKINLIDQNGYTPLSLTCELGNIEIAKYLAERGAQINIECENPPLHRSCFSGNLELVEYLIQKGADVNMHEASRNYRTPLHIAAEKGNIDIVKYLIIKGADTGAYDNFYSKPIFYAVKGNNLDIVKLLYGPKTNLNEYNMDGKTPLHMACQNSSLNIIQFIVQNGADVNVYTDVGYSLADTPLTLAVARGDIQIVKYLIEKGADINGWGSHWTPMHSAAFYGNLEIMKYLIEKGADPKVLNRDGESPLYIAEWSKNKNISSYLKKLGIILSQEENAKLNKYLWSHRGKYIFYSLIALIYVCVSIYLREYYYKKNLKGNWFGTINSMICLTVIISVILIWLLVSVWPSNPGFLGELVKINGLYWGIFIGVIIGPVLGFFTRNIFIQSRILYYFATLLFIGVCYFFCILG